MQRRARVPTPVLLVATVGVLVATLVLLSSGQSARSSPTPGPCDRFSQASKDRARVVTGTGRAVVVIGDSFSLGLGLRDPMLAWPTRMTGTVHVAGYSGSGFAPRSSTCGAVAFYQRAREAVRAYPRALVVVQGGLNDVGRTDREIRAGFRRLLAAIGDHRVLVVGPARAPSRAGGAVRVDRVLRGIASRTGTPYLSMLRHRFSYLEDRLHLTGPGQRAFGNVVRKAVYQRLR